MKCNVDTSFPNHENRFGIGMYIRNEVGAFLLAKTEYINLNVMCTSEKLWVNLLSTLQRVHELSLGLNDFEFD